MAVATLKGSLFIFAGVASRCSEVVLIRTALEQDGFNCTVAVKFLYMYVNEGSEAFTSRTDRNDFVFVEGSTENRIALGLYGTDNHDGIRCRR